MPEEIIKDIESSMENFKSSMTQENEKFISGVIYGLQIAKAIASGKQKKGRTQKK